jgi:hypothetical protein
MMHSYSLLNACMGSMLAARMAGREAATIAAQLQQAEVISSQILIYFP